MSNTYEALQKSHPCFGGQKNNVGHIHLPVSPGCNIACRFCERSINDVENRPGVTSRVLSPEEALEVLGKALELCPEIQLTGIRKVAEAGITIKVNTVLVPDINGSHIEEIARCVKEAGASIYNIIPLIPQAQLKGHPAPVCAEIDEARTRAGKYIDVFRHCQHCRADAAGVPGKSEYGDQIYQRRLVVKETFSHG